MCLGLVLLFQTLNLNQNKNKKITKQHEDKSVTFVTWMERSGWVTSMSAGEDQQASCKFFSTHQ